jgi:hypothetical protein
MVVLVGGGLGCEQDLDVRERTFYCQDDGDCLDGFVCRPFSGEAKGCVQATGDAGPTDVSDVTLQDAGDVTPQDTGDVTPQDAGDASDARDGDASDTRSDTSGDCPTARFEASVNNLLVDSSDDVSVTTSVLSTVEFDASGSSSPNGGIVEYEWTVVARPQGSTSRLNNVLEQTNELFIDVYGTYEIALEVVDSTSVASCEPASVTITAAPTDDVAIQLIWTTASDPDPTDALGADLDLHYLHPSGRWNEGPWDIFWNNKTADWGTANDPSDDPNLLIDDSDGAGPEHLVHSDLESGLTYSIGVHYYNDHDYGPSYAAVHIYTRGNLSQSYTDKYMVEQQFWDVGRIEAGSLQVTPIDQIYEEIPSQ